MPFTGQFGTPLSLLGGILLGYVPPSGPPPPPRLLPFTGQLGTVLSYPGNIEIGYAGPAPPPPPLSAAGGAVPGPGWTPGIRTRGWRQPSRSLTPMTPVCIMIPGEILLQPMPFTNC